MSIEHHDEPKSYEVKVIGHIRTEFATKFGVPRQSGLAASLRGKIVFEPKDRNPDALRGLEGYSHLWLLWRFTQSMKEEWSPTVRPPRLGGNTRMGVFATRSPFRPSPIGLSSVEIDKIELHTPQGPVIWVRGADLMDNTPILDIKPYLACTDSHPQARGGFASDGFDHRLEVMFEPGLQRKVPRESMEALLEVLTQDPRPSYQDDPERIYGMNFAGMEIHFQVENGLLTVVSLEEAK